MRCGLRGSRRSYNSSRKSRFRFCGSDASREAGDLPAAVLIAIVWCCGAGLCFDCGRSRGSCAAGFATCVAPTTATATATATAAPRFCRSDGSRDAGDLAVTILVAIVWRCGAGLFFDCGRSRGSCGAGFAAPAAPTTATATATATAAPCFCGSDGSREAGDLAATVLIAIVWRCGLDFVLIAGEAVDHAARASRLPPFPQPQQQQQQQQLSLF